MIYMISLKTPLGGWVWNLHVDYTNLRGVNNKTYPLQFLCKTSVCKGLDKDGCELYFPPASIVLNDKLALYCFMERERAKRTSSFHSSRLTFVLAFKLKSVSARPHWSMIQLNTTDKWWMDCPHGLQATPFCSIMASLKASK